jgi:hypothetical protein
VPEAVARRAPGERIVAARELAAHSPVDGPAIETEGAGHTDGLGETPRAAVPGSERFHGEPAQLADFEAGAR